LFQIFAITTVYPMLAYIYQKDITDGYKEAVLNIAILSGSMIGQVVFGIWADVVGRRKVYGMELVITIGATICVAMSARGEQQSMDIFGWLFFWKLVMGIGVGVEYPLSAVITSE
jgi:MFS transporter, PHS family, inorganic phosphate transporter